MAYWHPPMNMSFESCTASHVVCQPPKVPSLGTVAEIVSWWYVQDSRHEHRYLWLLRHILNIRTGAGHTQLGWELHHDTTWYYCIPMTLPWAPGFWRQIFWLIMISCWLNSHKYSLCKPSCSHWYHHHSPAPTITTPRKMSTRLIDVDDSSPLIYYQGPWALGNKYSVNTQFGGPFNNTLHVLTESGSFTFNFTGK